MGDRLEWLRELREAKASQPAADARNADKPEKLAQNCPLCESPTWCGRPCKWRPEAFGGPRRPDGPIDLAEHPEICAKYGLKPNDPRVLATKRDTVTEVTNVTVVADETTVTERDVPRDRTAAERKRRQRAKSRPPRAD